jgi:hypothetical protein
MVRPLGPFFGIGDLVLFAYKVEDSLHSLLEEIEFHIL